MAFPFFKAQQKPILIAHRGASGYAPENTPSAFKLALDMGARFIELDVHQTRDGQVIVTHDDHLARVAKLKKKVKDLNLAEIQKLTLQTAFNGRYAKEKIPTLEEVLTLVSRRAVINVEIKGSPKDYPGIEEKVLGILERKGYNGMSYISSESSECLTRIRSLASDAYLGYILGSVSLREALKKMRDLRCDALVVSINRAGRPLIQKAHQRGFHVCAYTVNKKSVWDQLAKRRVDAMFTDYPDLLGMPEFEEPTLGLTIGE